MLDEVNPKVSFPRLEEEIRDYWHSDGTFQASLELREGNPRFVFYEGPPTANGRPGTHHILARAFKDLFGRYKTMRGFYVERKAGWDTHGLPVELEIERKLGISGKQQIEEFGIAEFNRLCRESVHDYVGDWREFSERLTAQEGLQLHGGIGFTWEHDLHFFLKRAKAGGALWGTAAHHRAQVARQLGLTVDGTEGQQA